MLTEGNCPYRSLWMDGSDYRTNYLLGANAVGFSSDFLATIEDKMGDITSQFGTVGTFVGLCGG